jgi:biotin transporter BioY
MTSGMTVSSSSSGVFIALYLLASFLTGSAWQRHRSFYATIIIIDSKPE